MKKNLIEQVKRLPNGQKINVAVQNSGIFLAISENQAIDLLINETPNWKILMHETEDDGFQIFLYVEEGDELPFTVKNGESGLFS